MKSSTRKYIAEGIGTFVLVFGGVGAAVLAGNQIGSLGIALAFGVSLLAMAYAIGPISGCHINPAVTFTLLLSRKISGRDAAGYVVAQILGAIVATAGIVIIAKGQPGGYDILTGGLGANGYGSHSPGGFSLGACLLAETILTAILAFTVLGATSLKAPVGFAGLPIGLVLTLIHLVGIPITNTSVNPARSIGPALFVGHWAATQLWMFIVAPLVGAALAAGAYRALTPEEIVISTREAEVALDSQQSERRSDA
jgi:aquaporin Z